MMMRNFGFTALFLSGLICLLLGYAEVEKENISPGGEVALNEICTSNLSCLVDDEGDHPDWVELYNSSDAVVDLSGWTFTNKREGAQKLELAAAVIEPRSFLVVRFKEQLTLPEKGGELYLADSTGRLVDIVEIPALKYDTVYARTRDGKGNFERMTPTPGESNEGGEAVVYPTLPPPVFSRQSGFYEDEIELSITASCDGEIRYTLDGSVPGRDSALYSAPLLIRDRSGEENVYSAMKEVSVYLYDYYRRKDYEIPSEKVDKCTVVRAAVFDGDGNCSEVSTASYFIGFEQKKEYEGMAVLSIVSDPEGIFGYDRGIYVLGRSGEEHLLKRISEDEEASGLLLTDPSLPTDGSVKIGNIGFNRNTRGNYTMRGTPWEREAEFILFDEGKRLALTQRAGLRVKGVSSRQYPHKSLNIYARGLYDGSKRLRPEFDLNLRLHRHLTLSGGGNDQYTLITDALMSELTADLQLASMRFGRIVYVFLDGEFWGTYMMSEKQDADFFADNFNVSKDNVIFIKGEEVEVGVPSDINLYNELGGFVEEADFERQEDYEAFCGMVDIENLMRYFSVRIFAEYGIDWPHLNMGMWRCREAEDSEFGDTRWRFVNYDNNVELHYSEVSANMIDVVLNGSSTFGRDEMFSKLMENASFREDFLKCFKETVDTVFDPDRAGEVLDSLSERLKLPMSCSYSRWFGDRYTAAWFDEKTGEIKKFIQERPACILPMVEEACAP